MQVNIEGTTRLQPMHGNMARQMLLGSCVTCAPEWSGRMLLWMQMRVATHCHVSADSLVEGNFQVWEPPWHGPVVFTLLLGQRGGGPRPMLSPGGEVPFSSLQHIVQCLLG